MADDKLKLRAREVAEKLLGCLELQAVAPPAQVSPAMDIESIVSCGYHFADGQRCNETIYRADDTPTGWRHEQGDESRGMCHFARPEESGPQACHDVRGERDGNKELP